MRAKSVVVPVAVAAVCGAGFYLAADARVVGALATREGVSAAVTAVVLLAGLVVAGRFERAAERRRRLNRGETVGRGRRPEFVRDEVGIRYEGFLWKGLYGADHPDAGPEEARVYVEGPFCPDDRARLSERDEVRALLPDRGYWKCPRCGREYERTPYPVVEEVERGVRSKLEEGAGGGDGGRTRD